MQRSPLWRDRYVLYEASVQGEDYDLDFFERVYRRHHGRSFRLFREDFCGTASMATTWVLRRPEHRAWGIDLDPEPLAWARLPRLDRIPASARRRVTLVRGDVLHAKTPRVDLIGALNFSYWIFHERRDLVRYFRRARARLRPGGLLVVNSFGGTEAMAKLTERRRIAASQGPDGLRVPAYGYVWEHASFNPIDHHLVCHIHFRLADGTWMRRAFTYDWRMWMLPEVKDAMLEAGFADVEVYVEGWNDEKGEADNVYRLRKSFVNQEGWLAYIVGVT